MLESVGNRLADNHPARSYSDCSHAGCHRLDRSCFGRSCFGRSYFGHSYPGHSRPGHSCLGHSCLGCNYPGCSYLDRHSARSRSGCHYADCIHLDRSHFLGYIHYPEHNSDSDSVDIPAAFLQESVAGSGHNLGSAARSVRSPNHHPNRPNCFPDRNSRDSN